MSTTVKFKWKADGKRYEAVSLLTSLFSPAQQGALWSKHTLFSFEIAGRVLPADPLRLCKKNAVDFVPVLCYLFQNELSEFGRWFGGSQLAFLS